MPDVCEIPQIRGLYACGIEQRTDPITLKLLGETDLLLIHCASAEEVLGHLIATPFDFDALFVNGRIPPGVADIEIDGRDDCVGGLTLYHRLRRYNGEIPVIVCTNSTREQTFLARTHDNNLISLVGNQITPEKAVDALERLFPADFTRRVSP